MRRDAADGPREPGPAYALAAEEAARARAARQGRLFAGALALVVVAVALIPAGDVRLTLAAVVTFGLVFLGLSSRGKKSAPGRPTIRPAASAPWLQVAWMTFLVGFSTRQDAIILLGCVLIVAVLGSAILGREAVLRVRLERSLPPRAQAGTAVATTWRVHGPTGARMPPVLVRDPIGAGARPTVLEAEFEGGDAPDEASTAVVFDRRGVRRLRTATIATRHPLGAFESSIETLAPAEILVRPREGRLTRSFFARLVGASTTTGRVVTSRAGTEHLYGVRDYRDGDDPRRSPGRPTARRRVRTLGEGREGQAKRVVVALARGARHAPDADVERAISAAATLLRACARHGIRARLVRGDEDPPIEVGERRGLERALDALALLRWSGGKRPVGCLRNAGARRDPATVVWIGFGDDGEAAAAEKASGGAVIHLRVDDSVAFRRCVRGLP